MSGNVVARYLRSRGWKDFIFLCVAAGVWIGVRQYLSPPSDYARWKTRIKIGTELPFSPEPGRSGLPPCFFFVPPKAGQQTSNGQALDSGSIGDCLQLLPNGDKLDLFEIVLGGGFFPVKTDLDVPDTIPLAFTRTYIPLTEWSDKAQIYLPHVYDLFLTGSRLPYTYLDWRLPDGQSIHYERISSGTGYADAIYDAVSYDRIFTNSRINWNGWGWDWTLANGTTYLSPEAYNARRPQQGSLTGIFDKDGNEVHLSRDENGELMQIESPRKRWIRFEYSQLHLIRAWDNFGNIVEYEYDSGDRLTTVKYSGGQTTKYSYDMADRVTSVEALAEDVHLEIKYDPSGAVASLAINNTQNYIFKTVPGKGPDSSNVVVTTPEGKNMGVDIHNENNSIPYSIQK